MVNPNQDQDPKQGTQEPGASWGQGSAKAAAGTVTVLVVVVATVGSQAQDPAPYSRHPGAWVVAAARPGVGGQLDG